MFISKNVIRAALRAQRFGKGFYLFMEKYLQEKYDENFDAQYHHWREKALQNPSQTLKDIDAELKALYVRFDNDQEGRGQVAETGIAGTISGLEAVRAECLHLIKGK